MDIYQTLGAYYDDLVGDEQACRQWVDWTESFHPRKRILELACGSGEITHMLAESHEVTALDLSEQMLEKARAKDPEGRISFIEGDMRDLNNFGQFDAIVCYCDSFNYLVDEQDVKAFFQSVSDHLEAGGWFLFDAHGISRLEEFAQEYSEAGEFADGVQVQWLISAEGDLLYQDFAFYFPSRTIEEHHVQRVYDHRQLTEWLGKWFDVVQVQGDFGEASLEECEKVFFACRKKGDF